MMKTNALTNTQLVMLLHRLREIMPGPEVDAFVHLPFFADVKNAVVKGWLFSIERPAPGCYDIKISVPPTPN